MMLCAGQVMFDPYAGALTSVQLPEGTNVAPPKPGGVPPERRGHPGQPTRYDGLPQRAGRHTLTLATAKGKHLPLVTSPGGVSPSVQVF